MSQLSREHVDHYERRERQWKERLRNEHGSDVVRKLDGVTARDLIAERRQSEFDRLFSGTPAEPKPATPRPYRAVVNLATGRAAKRSSGAVPRNRYQRRTGAMRLRERGLGRLNALVQHVEERGGAIEDLLWLTHSAVVNVTGDQLVTLAARRDVSSVNHAKAVFAQTLNVSRPLIQADQVENGLGITGAGIDVAVLDTGVDFGHFALAAVAGTQQDFTGEGTVDLVGHGTHCAGIVASQDRVFRGVAPGATVHDYKMMFLVAGGGSTTDVIAVNAIQQAVADGREVLSNSWGFSHQNGNWVDPDGTCVLCTAANAAMANGSVFVVAGGNEDESTCGTYDTWIRCPGMAEDVLTVGASDASDNMANFSSRGPTPDARCKPDVTAPGVDICSCRASGTSMGDVVDADWTRADGTSMACPHVAGVAALMLEANGALTPAQVKDIIMATAVDIGADRCSEQGSGRVDALAAVNAV